MCVHPYVYTYIDVYVSNVFTNVHTVYRLYICLYVYAHYVHINKGTLMGIHRYLDIVIYSIRVYASIHMNTHMFVFIY